MIVVQPTDLAGILGLRDGYLHAVGAQIVHDAWHRRGRTTVYRLQDRSGTIGYGAVGGSPGQPHDTVKEFYLLPHTAQDPELAFGAFLAAARPQWLEAQTNDPFLAPLLQRFAPDHEPHTLLFADSHDSALPPPGALLRAVTPQDHATVFSHTTEPVGEWGLELAGSLVATGGLFFHYNPPFGDLYMEVAPTHRRRGYASYLLQELKRLCYQGGHVPAARCQLDNIGSQGALERAGMGVCGQIVRGRIVA
jgi:GNAT superfamily N-acetyltransferase